MTVVAARVEELVRQVAERHPRRPALAGRDETVDFAELDRRAAGLAGRLRAAGAGIGRTVAVRMPRSVEHAVAILACWQAGSACVPIDPVLPRRRIDAMLRTTGACLVVDPGGRISVFDGAGDAADPELAYVFFTSGSSAAPKAVGVPHRGIVNEACWTADAFGLTEHDRGSWLSSPGFAISRWELWSSLAAGTCVVVADQGVEWSESATRDWLLAERVTWSVVVTSLGERLFDQRWPADGALRLLVTGGEQLRRWPSSLPFDVVNSYGVTETSGVRSVAWLPRTPPPDGLPSIGRPIANTRLYVLDDEGAPVPAGTVGELYVGGVGLALGYLGEPERTAERFLPDPFVVPGARMYRSGDRVVVNADGDVEFVGRGDGTAKIDGVRVDVAEVEAVLLAHPAVSTAAAALRQGASGSRLVAYVVGRTGVELTADGLRSFLAERLPRVMVPTAFVALGALPVLVSGKVDRAALPEPAPGNLIEDAFTSPTDEIGRHVVLACRSALGTQRPIGGDEDFFGAGGDSLSMATVRTLLEERFGIGLPMAVLFESRTPSRIAAVIRARLGGAAPPAARSSRHELMPAGDEPLVLPLSSSQRGMWFAEAAFPGGNRYLEVVAVRLAGALDVPRLRAALGQLLARHSALRTTIDADGPEVRQVVHGTVPWDLRVVDVPAVADQDVLAALREHGLLAPLDLAAAPVFRWRLYRAADSAVLAFVIHHLFWDGGSADVLLRELTTAYDGFAGPPADDGVLVERHAEADDDIVYWTTALDGAPRVLWADPVPRTLPAGRIGVVECQFPAELGFALRSVAGTLGVTPFVIGVACLALALRRYHTADEVTFSSPVSIRPEQATDRIGLYVNMLVLRLRLSGQQTGRSFVESVRRTCLGAWQHRLVPFDRIVAETSHGRRPSGQPPYSQVMFCYNRFPAATGTADGVRWQVDLLPSREPKCDLMVSWNDKPAGMTMRIEHDTARIDGPVAADLADQVLAVLAALADDPDTALAALPGATADGAPVTPTLRVASAPDQQTNGLPVPAHSDGTTVRAQIAGMWCAVLGVETVDDQANFFDLNGNSIAAMRLVTLLRSTLGLRVPVRTVFDADSFGEFVAAVQRDHLSMTDREA